MPVRKILSLIAVAAVLITTMFSCDKDPVGPSVDSLIGKWILKSTHTTMTLDMGGTSMTMDTTETYTDESNYMDLKADNTYALQGVIPSMGSEEELFKKQKLFSADVSTDVGTWSLSGDNLQLVSTTADTTITMPVKVSGNSLSATMKFNESIEGMIVKGSFALSFKK